MSNMNPEKEQSGGELPDVESNAAETKPGEIEQAHYENEGLKPSSSDRDPNLVTWDGPDDPANPRNWSTRRKLASALVVSSFTFITPVSSSMISPALDAIATELHIDTEIEASLALSIFVLAYAVGPLFMGPLSELYGRSLVLQLANMLYFFFNLGCGLAKTKTQMIIFRFLAGLGGSAPLAIGGGVLGDLFEAEERGRAIAIYALMPVLGPAIGPIAGGFVTQSTTWRWIFYATTIADAVVQFFGLFLLRETFPPVLLRRKKLKLIKETGNQLLYTEADHPTRSVLSSIRSAMVRPFRLLGTQAIVQVLAVYMGYINGLIYLVLTTFPTLWTSPDYYNESVGIGGLNYISLGVGFVLGSQISAPLQDRIYRTLKSRPANNNTGRPEFRVVLMVPAAFLVPLGLFIYGWTAEKRMHWIAPNIGVAVFGAGTMIGFQCIQTYIIDCYTRYAASALAAITVLRSLAGFAFPLFASYMYDALGYGWGNSLLAFVAIALGCPAPFLLWRYGPALRERGSYAAG
jgi:multidrug resistance protein